MFSSNYHTTSMSLAWSISINFLLLLPGFAPAAAMFLIVRVPLIIMYASLYSH